MFCEYLEQQWKKKSSTHQRSVAGAALLYGVTVSDWVTAVYLHPTIEKLYLWFDYAAPAVYMSFSVCCCCWCHDALHQQEEAAVLMLMVLTGHCPVKGCWRLC
jgi:hypothetical protein